MSRPPPAPPGTGQRPSIFHSDPGQRRCQVAVAHPVAMTAKALSGVSGRGSTRAPPHSGAQESGQPGDACLACPQSRPSHTLLFLSLLPTCSLAETSGELRRLMGAPLAFLCLPAWGSSWGFGPDPRSGLLGVS